MTVFRYRAVTTAGEIVEGQREEADQAAVVRWIQGAGNIPIKVEPLGTAGRWLDWLPHVGRRRTVGRNELYGITEALAVLLKAGIPLEQALMIAQNTADSDASAKLLANVLDAVRGGDSFSSALETESGNFSPLFINIIRTSEAAGALDQGLERLNEYLQREKALRDEVVSATIYPLILFGVAVISIGLILAYVIPKVSELFVGYEELLPISTAIVIASAAFVRSYWWLILLGLLLGLLGLRHQLANPAGRMRWDARLLRVPYLGDLIAKIEVARLSRGLSTLLANGVPLVKALPLARGSLGNKVMDQALEQAMGELKDGGSLAGMFANTPRFPALALQLIKVGEETGNLEGMLTKVANIYEDETAKAAKRMLAVLEPALIVGLGVIIGGIIMSIMVAIISVNELPL